MPGFELLCLDLKSPLAYLGLENPPVSGAPMEGRIILVGSAPKGEGALVEASLGLGLAEGEEELFLFDEEELVAFDADEGPWLRRPLPAPRFYGRLSHSASELTRLVAAGGYAFLQWRPEDEEELLGGLEWFARETWWQRVGAMGPYMLRRIREEGSLATQALRRIG
jgi:hypothetical protein